MQEMLIGEYIRSQRKKQGMTQEELCEGICDISTLSRLERGKQTPNWNKVYALLHRLGLPEDRVFVLVSRHDLEIRALKRDIRTGEVDFEKADRADRPRIRERVMAELKRLEEIIEENDVINRQYILSSRATLGTPDGPYPPYQRRRMLEKAIRMTVPGFRPDRAERFRYRLEEMTILNKLARTFSLEGKREEAIDLYSRLLQNMEKNSREVEDYPGQFCLVAHNCAINLALAGKYKEALELARRGQQTGVQYGDYLFLPGFFAIQAECQFFLGDREKSAELYIRAAYLYDIIGAKNDLNTLREEMKEHLGLELPF